MNRHRLVDAGLHIEGKYIAESSQTGSREWVVTNDVQRIEKNFRPQITLKKPGSRGLTQAKKFKNAALRLAFGNEENPSHRGGEDNRGNQQRHSSVALPQCNQPQSHANY